MDGATEQKGTILPSSLHSRLPLPVLTRKEGVPTAAAETVPGPVPVSRYAHTRSQESGEPFLRSSLAGQGNALSSDPSEPALGGSGRKEASLWGWLKGAEGCEDTAVSSPGRGAGARAPRGTRRGVKAGKAENRSVRVRPPRRGCGGLSPLLFGGESGTILFHASPAASGPRPVPNERPGDLLSAVMTAVCVHLPQGRPCHAA